MADNNQKTSSAQKSDLPDWLVNAEADSDKKQEETKLKDFLALNSYIDELITTKKLELDSEKLPAYKELLMEQVMEALNTHFIRLLSEAQQIELEKLLDANGSREQVNQFLMANIPNFTAEATVVLDQFKQNYLFQPSGLPPAPVKKTQ